MNKRQKMRRIISTIIFILCFSQLTFAQVEWSNEIDTDIQRKMIVKTTDGFVPDAETAIKVAEAILTAIYGENVLNKTPFTASLVQEGTVWLVKGSLPQEGYFGGGIPYIKISKATGEILGVVHTK